MTLSYLSLSFYFPVLANYCLDNDDRKEKLDKWQLFLCLSVHIHKLKVENISKWEHIKKWNKQFSAILQLFWKKEIYTNIEVIKYLLFNFSVYVYDTCSYICNKTNIHMDNETYGNFF